MFSDKNNKIKNPTRLLKLVSHGSDLSILLINTSDKKYSYTALSHCWGSQKQAEKIPKLTRANFKERLSTAMSISDLTRTFQDAIEMTASLGFEYIWIDSLCIIQGDQVDWNQECGKMCVVYGGASLVLAAAYAKDGNDGLFAEKEVGRRIEFRSPAGHAIKAIVSAHKSDIDKHDIWKTGEQYWIADDLPLFTRAWAFQERMLAKRIVHFTNSELVWECRSYATSECGDLIDARTSWAEFGLGKTIKTKYQHVVDWGCDLERLSFWNDIAAQYSARNITKNSDRLPALASIARQIDCCGMLGRYLCGVWENSLPHSLLWWSEFKDLKHFPRSDCQAPTHVRSTVKCIPSWSWLSVEGRVSMWGRAVKVLVGVIGISYTLSGNDPYGQCEEAAIMLRGYTTPVRVCSSSQPDGTTAVIILDPASRQEFPFDADTHPFEYSENELSNVPIIALAFSLSGSGSCGVDRLCCMILRQTPERPDRHQWIGLAYLPAILSAPATPADIIIV
ncbi:heterokaryon incompatibility protein-domain-containing protein [Fusarium oxysporum]|nr:heterokaryon incompatibility protein-domain-containing protein [Fusarium oxysporum]